MSDYIRIKKCLSVAVATLIECREIPSGHLYAAMMGVLNIDEYQLIERVLVETLKVKKGRDHMLVWGAESDQLYAAAKAEAKAVNA